MTRILVNTWRRQGQVFGPVVRDMYGVEVAYSHVLQASGALPFLAPHPQPGVTAEDVLTGFDGLLLIGGEDLAAEVSGADPETDRAPMPIPERDRWEIALLTAALDSGVPVLAICRGMQLLNVAFGGTLHGHMTGETPEHPPVPDELADALGFRHRVDLTPHSRVHRAIGADSIETNSLHHQAVDRLGDGLIVTGTRLRRRRGGVGAHHVHLVRRGAVAPRADGGRRTPAGTGRRVRRHLSSPPGTADRTISLVASPTPRTERAS